jgi:hypothetical protein
MAGRIWLKIGRVTKDGWQSVLKQKKIKKTFKKNTICSKKIRISFFQAFIFECKKGRFIKSAVAGRGGGWVCTSDKTDFFAREDE